MGDDEQTTTLLRELSNATSPGYRLYLRCALDRVSPTPGISAHENSVRMAEYRQETQGE